MNEGYFYFLTDEYCNKHKKDYVMANKEKSLDGTMHNRPCYYALKDLDNLDIMWMIPVSSKVDKYITICEEKKKKYNIKIYEGIVFGFINGNKSAFLIQNMCPVLSTDILGQYINKQTNKPITISQNTSKHIINNARKLIAISKQGKRCTMTDIPTILKELNV